MIRFAVLLIVLVPLGGCATAMVTGAVVGAAATTTKVAAKTTIGAGKLVYRGTKAAVKGTAALVRDDAPAEVQ